MPLYVKNFPMLRHGVNTAGMNVKSPSYLLLNQDEETTDDMHQAMTLRQIAYIRLIVKSATGKSNTLTKSMLINVVKHAI